MGFPQEACPSAIRPLAPLHLGPLQSSQIAQARLQLYPADRPATPDWSWWEAAGALLSHARNDLAAWSSHRGLVLQAKDSSRGCLQHFSIEQRGLRAQVAAQKPRTGHGCPNPTSGDHRILSASLLGPLCDTQYSKITHHGLPMMMELSIFILDVTNKAWDDKNELYNSTHVGAQGHNRQSVHRDIHKTPACRCVLTMSMHRTAISLRMMGLTGSPFREVVPGFLSRGIRC